MYRLLLSALICSVFFGFHTTAIAQHHSNFAHLSPTFDNRPIVVSKTIQDAIGNIWMVQKGDIYVYDGYNYRPIANKKIFPNSERYELIKDIIIDANKTIWIISESGLLTKYDHEKGIFEDLTQQPVSVITSKDESLWLATKFGSIYRYANNKMDSITTISENKLQSKSIIGLAIGEKNDIFLSTGDGNILEYSYLLHTLEYLSAPFNNYPESLELKTDTQNRLWIGTETKGLFLYDITAKKFIQDSFFKGNTHNINNELFIDLYCDSRGFLWAGTDGGGLYKVNLITGEVLLYTKQPHTEFSLSSNTIIDIHEDNHHNIWITPNYGNLNILPNVDSNINYHEGSESGTPNRILSVFKSSDNVLWAGTDGAGLTKITFNADGTTAEEQFLYDVGTNKGFYIQSITEDTKGNIWIGTYKNGLWYYNSKSGTIKSFAVINEKDQKATDVRTLFIDSKARLWVGSNTALNIYSENLELLASFENNTNGLRGSIVQSIIETQNGTMWIGISRGGLFQFNENKNNLNASTFVDRSILNENLDRVQSIKSITEGAYNSLWLLNDIGELLKYDIQKNSFTTFKDLAELSNRALAAVINTKNDDLWISSDNGIINFNAQDSIINTYYITDGLQDNLFLSRSAFKDYKGMLFFGGSKGLNYFYPQDLNKKESNPILQISSLEILNQPAEVILPEQIESGIANVKTLYLENNQSSFSFRFAALDNLLYPKHFYAYRLKGFDKDWIYSHLESTATYTNIPAGRYTFEFKAGTKDGVWNIPTKSIEIVIKQPFWNTLVAWALYACLLLLGIYGLKRWYSLKKKLFVEKINNKNDNEMYHVKMNFFAKMSHEIQTPLTLILGPIDDMIRNAEKNGNLLLKQRLSIIAYNTKRLSKIAYELTLVRNKELDKLRLKVSKSNFSQNIDAISQSFDELARKKNIDFIINCPENLIDIWYDKEKIEHIIYNLLSNAFKFTPKEGSVQLTVLPINSLKTLKLSVTDSGSGVPQEELNSIFELFYQTSAGKKKKLGTGIGLALTKELIDLHKGKIEVESSSASGTIFTITFPISEDAYTDSERITADYEEEDYSEFQEENNSIPLEIRKYSGLKKTILVVEDTFDLQQFLKELLQDHYNVIVAENGNEGYQMAKTHTPDLILSDIMMPELDGIEMSKLLQEDSLTRHIPVILLTAKNSTHSKMAGLKSGAIEYINKPFNTNELLLKIQNILISKEHIISKYRKEVITSPEVSLEKSQDEVFLENLVANINLRMEDADFKIDELAIPLNMSYSSMYRKCQFLTGKSLVDFVRSLRLKKAAVLITRQGYTISEAAFMTGFNDPKYFSRCFKKEFNKSPADFKKEAQKIGIDEYLNKNEVGSFL